jgi:signal peptidase I
VAGDALARRREHGPVRRHLRERRRDRPGAVGAQRGDQAGGQLLIGDRVITFRLAYLISNPKRGDVIVFPYPDDEKVDFIKRIIGLPGETIEGKDGLVYIDGKPLKEPYVKDKIDSDFGPYVVPEDGYFMMGDNRNNSEDSRYWEHKFVSQDKIKGKAILKYPNLTLFDTIHY